MQDTLSEEEPHAQRSWHLQRSPPAHSEEICAQKCGWASLSDDQRLVEEHARLRVSHKCVYARA